jgi:cobalamin biosynthesis protein CobD/CbiB
VTLLALIAALLVEQARALSTDNPVHRAFRAYTRFVDRSLDGGTYQQGVLAWLGVVVPVVGAVLLVSVLLDGFSAFALLLFDIAILYLTMGFRKFSHAYSDTLHALRIGDLDRARTNIGRWTGQPAEQLESTDISRIAIERGLCSAHRHVFGVVAWYAVFGASGAVLYRVAATLRDHWGARHEAEETRFGAFSATAFEVLDWVPARITAVSFAVVGDFEDALYCWRTQADAWPDASDGVVLASGAGALGVRLGASLGGPDALEIRSELGMGDEADSELMTSAVGLIWRALVLWLFVLLLVTVASWLG